MSKAAQTRLMILEKAFQLIYENGYQATSIDQIISTVEVTKGAFFYHFKNKEEMGMAIIKELMRTGMKETCKTYLEGSDDPANDIYKLMKFMLLESPFFDIRHGCPAMNMIDEMAPVNEAFNNELTFVVKEMQSLIIASVEKGKASGKIRQDINPKNVAFYITAGYAGVRNMGKIFGEECYLMHLQELKVYFKNFS